MTSPLDRLRGLSARPLPLSSQARVAVVGGAIGSEGVPGPGRGGDLTPRAQKRGFCYPNICFKQT